jgi:hypothetical protein
MAFFPPFPKKWWLKPSTAPWGGFTPAPGEKLCERFACKGHGNGALPRCVLGRGLGVFWVILGLGDFPMMPIFYTF